MSHQPLPSSSSASPFTLQRLTSSLSGPARAPWALPPDLLPLLVPDLCPGAQGTFLQGLSCLQLSLAPVQSSQVPQGRVYCGAAAGGDQGTKEKMDSGSKQEREEAEPRLRGGPREAGEGPGGGVWGRWKVSEPTRPCRILTCSLCRPCTSHRTRRRVCCPHGAGSAGGQRGRESQR